MAGVFDAVPRTESLRRHQNDLRELLTPKEYDAARRTVLNAHYTAPGLVRPIWQLVRDLGFDGGQVLEPGCGIGAFLVDAPASARLTGVELDPVTATIARHLHPTAEILTQSFADTRYPGGHFDLVVGNVPFGKYQLHDPQYNPAREHSIHNHFIIKALHLTAPGGLVAVLTSRYTLDAQNPAARRTIARLGDLVGAVRLPTGAHRASAGTDAVTDLLVLRRRTADRAEQEPAWCQTDATELPADGPDRPTVLINRHFRDHPEMVLGRLAAGRGLYSGAEVIVEPPDGRGVADALTDAVSLIGDEAQTRGLGFTADPARRHAAPVPVARAAVVDRMEGHLAADRGGAFVQIKDAAAAPLAVPASQRRELLALLNVRDAVVDVLQSEAATLEDTAELDQLRDRLNQRYDRYAATYGPINRFTEIHTARRARGADAPVVQRRNPPVMRLFRTDPHAPLTLALERFDDTTQTADKADIFRGRVVVPRSLRLGAETPEEAVAICLDTHGEVRLDTMAALLGIPEGQVPDHAAGRIYFDPAQDRWVAAAEYLSGNVRVKLDQAVDAVPDRPSLQANVDALRAVLPADLGPGDIAVRLGAVWVPAGDVQDFLRDLLRQPQLQVEHAGGSQWDVRGYGASTLASSTWGTERFDAVRLAQALLTQSPVLVYDTYRDSDNHERRILNPTETYAAQDKAEQLNERFAEWLWTDPERATRLCRLYNHAYNGIVLREYDGSHLTLPGLAATFQPRPHQRDAVARMIAEPAVGLFHDVGAGKTAEMVIGCMELRRLGLVSKPAVVVPNHMLEQFGREWLQLYPQARILAASTADLTGESRRQFVARAATGSWDGIILTRGAFSRLDVATDTLEDYTTTELDVLRTRLDKSHAASGLGAKRVERQIAALEERLKAQLEQPRDPGVTFEESGIDYLAVDELHDYKNLTTPSNIPGAAIAGSARALDLHLKLHHLRSRHGTRVVTGATATPIANSITEAYVMQRYLRPDLLLAAGLEDFDSWAATFGRVETALEIGPTGQPRMNARFSSFVNVPELLRMWHVSSDIKTAEDLRLPVPDLLAGDGTDGAQVVTVPISGALSGYMQVLQRRAEAVKGRAVSSAVDNMLVITSDGRKAALDLRLLSDQQQALLQHVAAVDETKVTAAADQIVRIHQATRDRRYLGPTGEPHPRPGALQIVFCDLGTPPASTEAQPRYTVYDDLQAALVARGVPADQIRFVHEATNDAAKARLFEAARTGQISVLIGSTQKMGVGTNIQARAVALHHLDCPWRPADIAQRDGRIMRQGNQNDRVEILRYVTERSFDAVLWGTIARKARFIGQVMRGRLDVREIEDIGHVALDAAQVAAVVTGDNRLLVKAQLDADIGRMERLERAHGRNQRSLAANLDALGSAEREQRRQLGTAEYHTRTRRQTSGDQFSCRLDGRVITSRSDAQRALLSVLHAGLGRRGGEVIPVGTVGGVNFEAVLQVTTEGRAVDLHIEGLSDRGDRVRVTPTDLTGDRPGHGLITRLENRAAQLPETVAALRRAIARSEQETLHISAQLGAPFKHAEPLQQARTQRDQLVAEIATEASDTERAAAVDQDLALVGQSFPATATPGPPAASSQHRPPEGDHLDDRGR